MKLNAPAVLFAVVGLAALAAALFHEPFRIVWLLVAVTALFLAATANSKATRLSQSLQPFVGKAVRVEVWGNAISDSSRPALQIEADREHY